MKLDLLPKKTNELPRLLQVECFLKINNLKYAQLAKIIGCSRTGAQRLLRADHIPTKRHKQLVACGFPDSILPLAKDFNRSIKRE